MTSRRSVPSGLHRAGRALWTSITDFYELDPGERSTLEQAARLADSAEELHAVIDAEGPMVAGSRGQPRLNLAVAELRATRAAIGSLVARLKLPSTHTTASGPGSVTSAKARAAARARWNARKAGA